MNVVIAIDSFKGSMTSLEAGESASAGIRRIYPDADIAIRPLADGGEGTVDALTLGCGGTRTQVCVTGPLEKPVLCSYGILDADKTAVIEMSGAAGITLLSETERNPLYTTTYGVGGSHQRRHCQRLQTFYYRNRRKCHKRWRNRYAAGTGI